MPPSTSARLWRLGALIVALTVVPLAHPAATAAVDPPPTAAVDLSEDMAPIQVAEVAEGVLPPALSGDSAVAAASVEPIQPGQGFTPWQVGVPNFGGYRFQLVEGTPESVRPWLQAVADQLSAMTSVAFSVDPGTVARPAGSATNLFATGPADPSTWGVIRVLMPSDNLSPCGTLSFIPAGIVGCGGPDDVSFRGARTHVRGNIWLATGLRLGTASLQAETTAHEAGHAIGLAHHDSNFEGVSQLMNSTVSGSAPPGRCGTRLSQR